MNKTQLFLKKHSSTILTVVGAAGVVATSVLTAKATPKALNLLVEAEQEKGGELTIVETVKAAWKPYIPSVISGVSTIACIFGANYLSARSQASLMSAYALLDSSYQEYRSKTKELYKEEATNIEREIVKSKLDKNMTLNNNKQLFFDFRSMQWFESTMEDVLEAEETFNENFVKSGFAYLNDFYELLNIPLVDYGYDIGWYSLEDGIKFEHEKGQLDDGLEYYILSMSYPQDSELQC